MPPQVLNTAASTRDAHAPAFAAPEAPSLPTFGPIRPDRLTIWPNEGGTFGIDVRWDGRECILRAVVVRRLLSEAGYSASVANSLDGRTWELTVRDVPAGEVAKLVERYIW